MEFFTCPVCKVTQPVQLGAFGLPGVDVCNECCKKNSEKDNNGNSQRHIQTGVEVDKNPASEK